MRCFAIAGTPRVGGNWLAQLLNEHAGLPVAREWLTAPVRKRVIDGVRLTPAAYLARVWERHSGVGTFGALLHWDQLDQTFDFLIAEWGDVFPPDSDPVWIFLTRRDVEAQARSWITAWATDTWQQPKVPYLNNIDADLLDTVVRRINRQNSDWLAWLPHGYITTTYEEIADDPPGLALELAHRIKVRWAR